MTDRIPIVASLVAAAGALLLGGTAALPAVRPLVFALTGVAVTNPLPAAQFGVVYVVVGLGVVTTGHRRQSTREAVVVVTVAFAGVATVAALFVGTAIGPLLLQTAGAAPVAVASLVGAGRTPLERAVAALGAGIPLALRYGHAAAVYHSAAAPGPAFTTALLAAMNVVAALPVVYLGWRNRERPSGRHRLGSFRQPGLFK